MTRTVLVVDGVEETRVFHKKNSLTPVNRVSFPLPQPLALNNHP